MAEDGVKDEGFGDRRATARARAGELQARYEQSDDPTGWFDALYRAAGDDAAQVPWADLEPHPLLSRWLTGFEGRHEGAALDVGCGLGDNAAALATAGYAVTAFDLSPTAIDWAKKRFGSAGIDFCVANLLELPDDMRGRFDLVQETYTLQSLKDPLRRAAFAALASTLAPGGRLLVICRSRRDDEMAQGPPWPLSPAELARFEALGLEPESFEAVDVTGERVIPHIVATWIKPQFQDRPS
jgi:SAM-dependent methyltransferase